MLWTSVEMCMTHYCSSAAAGVCHGVVFTWCAYVNPLSKAPHMQWGQTSPIWSDNTARLEKRALYVAKRALHLAERSLNLLSCTPKESYTWPKESDQNPCTELDKDLLNKHTRMRTRARVRTHARTHIHTHAHMHAHTHLDEISLQHTTHIHT